MKNTNFSDLTPAKTRDLLESEGPPSDADNRIIGCQVLAGNQPVGNIGFGPALSVHNSFSEATVRVFTTPHTSLQSFVSEEQRIAVYVWGIPAHTEVKAADIPAWCANVVAAEQYIRFRELLGTFVVVVDEPRKGRLTFVSDILGIRPLFLGRRKGQLVFGSDIWSMHEAGLTSGEVDYASVSSWIAYGCGCTGGSFFADLRRLAPGAALVIQDGRTIEVPYVQFNPDSRTQTTEEAAEYLHETVSSSLKAMISNQPRLCVPLSGGFDSRYLLALALRENAHIHAAVNVRFTREEGEIAREVAGRLGVSLIDFPVDGNIWDIYDEVYHFAADGFPISRFVIYCIARKYLHIPVLNGFLGGVTIRGFDDAWEGKYEDEFTEDLASMLQRRLIITDRRAFRGNLFRSDIERSMISRSRAPMEELVRLGAPIGKVVDRALLFNHQRHLVSNNFLQHLGLSEALLPFYNWRLIAYKMEHPYRMFNDAVYAEIFRQNFPNLADITHSDYLRKARLQHDGNGMRHHMREWWKVHRNIAQHTKRWARRLLPVMVQKHWLELLRKDVCVPLTLLGCTDFPQGISRYMASTVEKLIMNFERLYLLEKRAKEARVDFSWEGLCRKSSEIRAGFSEDTQKNSHLR